MRYKADIPQILPFDQVDYIGNVRIQIDSRV
jgi:hypothetical protein